MAKATTSLLGPLVKHIMESIDGSFLLAHPQMTPGSASIADELQLTVNSDNGQRL